MKKLLALLLFVAVTASAQDARLLMPSPIGVALTVGTWVFDRDKERVYRVEVVGVGANEKQAREEGFRVAIEHAVGELVLSETTNTNRKYVNYSSGYVKSYKIHDKQTVDGNVRLIMTIDVSSSKIANRLHSDAVSKLPVQYATRDQATARGDAVLSTVLADYPKKAYRIDIKDLFIDRGADRTNYLGVMYDLEWNRDFVQAIGEAIEATKENVDRMYRNKVYKLEARFRDDYSLFNKSWTAHTIDDKRYDMFRYTLRDTKIKLSLKDAQQNILLEQCFDVEGEFTSMFNMTIIIDGNYKQKKRILRIPINEVEGVDNVQLAVVKLRDCGGLYAMKK
jgi:hypothetical protein